MDNPNITDELAKLAATEADEQGLCEWTCAWTGVQTDNAE